MALGKLDGFSEPHMNLHIGKMRIRVATSLGDVFFTWLAKCLMLRFFIELPRGVKHIAFV